jgi:mRNA interferase HigB
MRVHLIRKQTIEAFCEQFPQSKTSFREWLAKLKRARWQEPGDIRETYCSSDLLGRGSSRVVFNISGNRYRMIVRYVFGEKQVHLFICWIGNHSEYDSICREQRQYTVNEY